jgi:hypothetical protein
MWGRAVIMPIDAEEVRQEFAFSGNDFKGNGDEGDTTPRPQSRTTVEELEEEHTLRSPSTERMDTPPPPESEGEGVSRMSPGSGRFETLQ